MIPWQIDDKTVENPGGLACAERRVKLALACRELKAQRALAEFMFDLLEDRQVEELAFNLVEDPAALFAELQWEER